MKLSPVAAKRLEHGCRGLALVVSLVLSACLMALAIGMRSHPWLGWVSLPPLLLSIRYLSPLKALGCGSLWGVALFLFSAATGSTAVAPTFGNFALLATVPGLYTLFGSLLTRSRVGFSPLLLGMAWIGVEYALAPLSLRFGLLAGTVARGSFLHVVAGLLGYGFIAFVIAFANGLLLSLLTEARLRVSHPLFVAGSGDPGAIVVPVVFACDSYHGPRAARPRAPPVW